MNRKCATALSVLLFLRLGVAQADDAERADSTNFDIPPLTLEGALIRFSEQADTQLVMASADVDGKAVGGLHGELSRQAALNELLAGTGLEHKFIANDTIAIGPAASKVKAAGQGELRSDPGAAPMAQSQAPTQSRAAPPGGGRTDAGDDAEPIEVINVYGRSRQDTLREVPQSARVFGAEFLTDVGATDLFNVIRFVPSAASRRSQMGYLPDEFFIRGFESIQTINGTSINALNHSLDTQMVERVEVLMGPASVLYGSMEPGAVINIVTKQPQNEFHFDAGAEFGSYDNHRFTVDVGGPISDRIRVRLNAAYQDRESFLDYWSLNKRLLSPVVELDLTQDTLLTVEGLYSREEQPAGPYIGHPAAGILTPNPFGQYRRSFFIQDPDRDEGVGLTREATRLDVRLQHDFSEALSGRAAFSYTHGVSDEGDMLSQGFADDDFRTLRRFFFLGINNTQDVYSYYLDLAGDFTTGPIRHRISIGADYVDSRSDNGDGRGGFFTTPVDIFNPVYGAILPDPLLLNSSYIDSETSGIFVQDRMSVGDVLHLIAGTRYARIDTSILFVPAGGQPGPADTQRQSDWPTMFGLVYNPIDSVSLFANRSESFMPRSGTTQGGASFPPERSLQYEAGAKLDLGDTGLSANIALFEVEKPDVLTPDLGNPGFEVPLGTVRSRGVELSVQGRLRPTWTVYGSYTHMKTKTESNDPDLNGNELRLAPNNTFSVMTRYDFLPGPFEGLGLTGSLQFVDDRYINDGNTLLLPGYMRVDLGAHYSLNDRVEFSILMNNVTDEDIYSGWSPNEVEIDLPRAVLARMKFRLQ